ncbi:MAG: adenylosuccinate lyase [Bryobacterales bacterium]|nr:adenylosuccinate lyase [Bryobacterales bacterium]
MIPRYTRPCLGEIWSDQNKFRQWLEVELVASEVLAELGEVPSDAARALRRHADFDLARIEAIEAEVRHDVIAFLTSVSEKMAEAGVARHSRWLHYGLTSNDVVDTAQALLLKQASEPIARRLEELHGILAERAFEFKDTPTVGRTHGVHAEPTTFGLKLANWYSEVGRQIERFDAAREQMRVGKLSGAVGTLAHISPQAESEICERLGLQAVAVSNQVIQRDRHAHFVCTLANIAATIEKIAVEVRHLQRTEVREAQEYFSKSQKGSSAMPHKKNPIVSENLSGLARVLRGNAAAALENVALWHERDISHSSVERVILADSTTLVDYMLAKACNLVRRLLVYPDRMAKNLEANGGLVYSGQLLLEIAAKGVLREEAYRWVQRNALRAWEQDDSFREMVESDPDISGHLGPDDYDRAFSLDRQLRNVDAIFRRVFGKN